MENKFGILSLIVLFLSLIIATLIPHPIWSYSFEPNHLEWLNNLFNPVSFFSFSVAAVLSTISLNRKNEKKIYPRLTLGIICIPILILILIILGIASLGRGIY